MSEPILDDRRCAICQCSEACACEGGCAWSGAGFDDQGFSGYEQQFFADRFRRVDPPAHAVEPEQRPIQVGDWVVPVDGEGGALCVTPN